MILPLQASSQRCPMGRCIFQTGKQYQNIVKGKIKCCVNAVTLSKIYLLPCTWNFAYNVRKVYVNVQLSPTVENTGQFYTIICY